MNPYHKDFEDVVDRIKGETEKTRWRLVIPLSILMRISKAIGCGIKRITRAVLGRWPIG